MQLERGNEWKTMIIKPIMSCIRRSAAITLRLAIGVMVLATLASSVGTRHELLYVVDTGHQNENKAQVLVVDTQSKTIVKTYRAGYHPDLAVSPDGSRLYLSYDLVQPDAKTTGIMDVIDTATGSKVTSVSDPDRVYDTMDDVVSHMALSADGGLLYIARVQDLLNGEVAFGVAVFDTATNKFLPDMISLPRCGEGLLVPSNTGRTLSVVCRGSRDVRITQFDAKGIPLTRLPGHIPLRQHNEVSIATAFMSGDEELSVVLEDGNYSKIDLQAGKYSQEGIIAFSPPLKAGKEFVGPFQTAVWHGRVFLVLGTLDDYRSSGLASAIAVLDLKNLQQERIIEVEKPFSNVAIASDGTLLIADPESSAMHMLTASGTETGKITGVGVSPTIVVPSP
jgi:hypothetical protein